MSCETQLHCKAGHRRRADAGAPNSSGREDAEPNPGGTRMVLVTCPSCSWQCQAGFPAAVGGVYTIQCPSCSSSFVMQIQPNACSTSVLPSTGAFPPGGAAPPVGALPPAAAPVAAPPLNPTPLPLPPLAPLPQLPSLANVHPLDLQLAMHDGSSQPMHACTHICGGHRPRRHRCMR